MGDIPSLAGSEQPRLVKVGKGHCRETRPEDLGFNLLEGHETYDSTAVSCSVGPGRGLDPTWLWLLCGGQQLEF